MPPFSLPITHLGEIRGKIVFSDNSSPDTSPQDKGEIRIQNNDISSLTATLSHSIDLTGKKKLKLRLDPGSYFFRATLNCSPELKVRILIHEERAGASTRTREFSCNNGKVRGGLEIAFDRSEVFIEFRLEGKGQLLLNGSSISFEHAERPVGMLFSNNQTLPFFRSSSPNPPHFFEPCSFLPETPEEWYRPSMSTVDGNGNSGQNTVVFLTIDTEDTYFDRPRLITGEGIPNARALDSIMTAFEERGFKGTFFLNIYEHLNYKEPHIERIAREISERGHAVDLHIHPTKFHKWFHRNITHYSKEQQKELLLYGKNKIKEWTGQDTITFRAGGFNYNEATLKALEETGFRIDSSYNHTHVPERLLGHRATMPYQLGELVEVPLCYSPLVIYGGKGFKHSWLDINALRDDELIAHFDALRQFEAPFVTLIMHSFSFIRKMRFQNQRRPAAEHPDGFLFRSDFDQYQGYVDIYEANEPIYERFIKFLDHLVESDGVEVAAMGDRITDLESSAANKPGVEKIPIIRRN